jgi:hypothetical protein
MSSSVRPVVPTTPAISRSLIFMMAGSRVLLRPHGWHPTPGDGMGWQRCGSKLAALPAIGLCNRSADLCGHGRVSLSAKIASNIAGGPPEVRPEEGHPTKKGLPFPATP